MRGLHFRVRLGKVTPFLGVACLVLSGCGNSSSEFGDNGSPKAETAKPLTAEQKKAMPAQAAGHVDQMSEYAKAQSQAMAGRRSGGQ